MKGKKKRNNWLTAIAAIVAVMAIYFAFDMGRGTYYNNLGTTHMAEGEYDDAISCFTRALKARRKSPEAYSNRGAAYGETGEHVKAIADFNKAIEMSPEFSDAYYNRAAVYYHMKEYDKAWVDVNKARSLGHQIGVDFLDALRELSGREE